MPVIVTVLDLLEGHGPHGQIWRRYGRTSHDTLTDALANPDDYHAYSSARNDAGWRIRRRANDRSGSTRKSAGAGR
ncbi:hypothetical protein ACFWHQ_37930 [Streptomyces sp. NPDC060334]|uniref:hypothetical protein n=1 Tax=Streptomyces sp. NPDC060334 TaxID=3347099 RepID=UPI003660C4E0